MLSKKEFVGIWLFKNTGTFYLLYVVLMFVSALLVLILPDGVKAQLPTIAVDIIPYLFNILLIVAFATGTHAWPMLGFKRFDFKNIAICFLIGIPIFYLIGSLSMVSNLLIPAREIDVQFGSDNLLILILVYALLPAMIEEMAFRGLIYTLFRNRSLTVGIIVSALCFSFMHMSLTNILPTFIFGILMALVREITESIYPSMLIHLMHNTYMLCLAKYSDSTVSKVFMGQSTVSWIIGTVIAVVCIAFGLKILSKRNDWSNELEPNDNYPIMPAGCIAGLLICFVVMILTR